MLFLLLLRLKKKMKVHPWTVSQLKMILMVLKLIMILKDPVMKVMIHPLISSLIVSDTLSSVI